MSDQGNKCQCNRKSDLSKLSKDFVNLSKRLNKFMWIISGNQPDNLPSGLEECLNIMEEMMTNLHNRIK